MILNEWRGGMTYKDGQGDIIATNDFIDAQGRIYINGKTMCSQCGQEWTEPACGPTHALVVYEIKEGTKVNDAQPRVRNDEHD